MDGAGENGDGDDGDGDGAGENGEAEAWELVLAMLAMIAKVWLRVE